MSNQVIIKPNEFVIKVIDEMGQLSFELVNPHLWPGNDGQFDTTAWSALHALFTMEKRKLRRLSKSPKIENYDAGDPELHGG